MPTRTAHAARTGHGTGTGHGARTAGPTGEFFRDLAERNPDPPLTGGERTLRVDLESAEAGTEHWAVTVGGGAVAASRREVRADTVIKAPRHVFDDIVTGRQNATTAVLRGLVEIHGDPGLLMWFERQCPGPARKGPSRRVGRQAASDGHPAARKHGGRGSRR